MYKHRPTTPDWLYYPANISPKLVPELSRELLALYHHVANLNGVLNLPGFLISRETEEFHNKTCPIVMSMLKQLKIQNFFQYFCFVTNVKDQETHVHVDNVVDFGLNIPVLNCHDTYTVWYDSEPIGKNVSSGYQLNFEVDVLSCHQSNMKEIGRCNSTVPHWINVNVPHQPMVMHDQLRINASLRFDNELLIDRQLPYWVYKK
jgi:hypothetical protein